MIQNYSSVVHDIQQITGKKNVLTAQWDKQAYSKGWRYGEGEALAVAKP